MGDGKRTTSSLGPCHGPLQLAFVYHPLTLEEPVVVPRSLLVFLPKHCFQSRAQGLTVPAIESFAVGKEHWAVCRCRARVEIQMHIL